MSTENYMDQERLWQNLVKTYLDYCDAQAAFYANGYDRVNILKKAFYGRDYKIAIAVAQGLPQEDLVKLLPELIYLASYSHGAIQAVRDLIYSLPKECVLGCIEENAGQLLAVGTYDEYRRILELCVELDKELTREIALRAICHDDKDIQEAGRDLFKIL